MNQNDEGTNVGSLLIAVVLGFLLGMILIQ